MVDTEIQIAGGDTATPTNLRKRVDIVMRHISPGATVLDCGCGAGEYVRALRGRGLRAFGAEIQAPKLDDVGDAVRSYLVQADLQQLGIESSALDAVLLNEVLEHVPSETRTLAEVRRVLRPDGTLIVMSPNRCFPFESHGVSLRRSGRPVPPYVPFVPYVPLRLGRRHLRYWARNYWPRELRRLLEDAGFRVMDNGYVWQTFEGISGNQPRLLRAARPGLRAMSSALEQVPGVRRFGLSQFVVAVPAG